ncbi:helix-turn-helix transcriptional regulator [Sphingosinicella sp. LHD-64]|uniref:AraC family transcriptional regulator n=1 Tax=Sphingosinicella sp. LHD-64 TaxID=3072139 RepID=UPI0028105909|nr:helix-turn-helix transcriptional regulator [Sphingosinicella sp. LHD-64]MDQ8755263.1 helix-turn-helix transcriptional regulator [Sphingosinicella sp. LHD-64]
MSRKRHTRADEPFLIVRTLASNARAGEMVDRHRHDWHQLIYASAGVLHVSTERGAWIAPPHWAIWVPAGVEHDIRFATGGRLRTIYLRPDVNAQLPRQCTVVTVSPLLRELILKAVDVGMLDRRETVDLALATLILDEFRQSGTPPFALPQPESPAASRAAALIAAGASPARDMAALAKAAGAGVRTLERRFRAETGMSPAQWRRHREMLAALERLAGGAAIKEVADHAGYAAPSAFVAAFRRQFGVTPGRYFQGG